MKGVFPALLMKYEKRETRKGGKSFSMFGLWHEVIRNDPILEPKLTTLFGFQRGSAPSVIKCFQGELIVSGLEVKSAGPTHSMSAGSALPNKTRCLYFLLFLIFNFFSSIKFKRERKKFIFVSTI